MKDTEMKTVRIGIASYEAQKRRLMAIARGEHVPGPDEPKIWFASIESVAQVLSTRNQALLRLIREVEPESVTELAALSGRKQGNLTRTLKTLQRYGLVDVETAGRARKPRAMADRFEVAFGAGELAAEEDIRRSVS